ncbi:hypothetical protein [Metabacillus litoralis]|uniref:hypothetical protein n=1 Tax=Metabacillus TaxID=2675233 RepID=UPI001B95A54A|nr:hypothetical protein [Metabacillus litoralis]MCM3164518.1 hypothetical protein [Metabacillus litoralis]
MRILISVGIIFGSLFLFSLIPEFMNFMIDIGVVPNEPRFRDSFWFQIQGLFLLWVMLWIIISLGYFIVVLSGGFFDFSLHHKIKKAKKRAIKEFGTDLPYFGYLSKKLINGFYLDVSNYPKMITMYYLSEKGNMSYEDMYSSTTKEDRQKLYLDAKEYYGLPEMSEYDLLSHVK